MAPGPLSVSSTDRVWLKLFIKMLIVKSRPDVYQQKSAGVYHLWSAKGYQWR
jgi:hypothetical protein